MPSEETSCFICQKHRGEVRALGGAIYEDEVFYVGHAEMPEQDAEMYLGALVLEPMRHVNCLSKLTGEEAARMGMLVTALSRVLRQKEGAEHVYLFRMGHHVDHLHVWVVPRYPGAPREYWGLRFDEWPDAPRGGNDEVETICGRLRAGLKADGWLAQAM
jgi:diadenosine tetraphosphate (Ap4A) HIT family hydrolase